MKIFARFARAAVVAAALAPGLALAPGHAFAQANDEVRYDYYGRWSISYPATWVLDLAGWPIIASYQATVDTVRNASPMPIGTMAIGVIPPEDHGIMGVPAGSSVIDTLTTIARIYGITSAPEAVPALLDGAYAVPLVGGTRVSSFANLVAFERGGTVFTFIVVVEDFTAAIPTLSRILGSVTVASR